MLCSMRSVDSRIPDPFSCINAALMHPANARMVEADVEVTFTKCLQAPPVQGLDVNTIYPVQLSMCGIHGMSCKHVQ